MQIGRLEEEPTPGADIPPLSLEPLSVAQLALLEQRTVAGVDDRAGAQLVRAEQVRQDPALIAVVLCDCTDEQLRRELIGRPRVQNVDGVHPRTGVRTIEGHTRVVDLLAEPAGRLKRSASGKRTRAARERRLAIVEDRP